MYVEYFNWTKNDQLYSCDLIGNLMAGFGSLGFSFFWGHGESEIFYFFFDTGSLGLPRHRATCKVFFLSKRPV